MSISDIDIRYRYPNSYLKLNNIIFTDTAAIVRSESVHPHEREGGGGAFLCGKWKVRVEMKKEKKACDGRERKGRRRERSVGDERGRRTRLEGEEINPLSLMTQLMQQFMSCQRHGRQERKR